MFLPKTEDSDEVIDQYKEVFHTLHKRMSAAESPKEVKELSSEEIKSGEKPSEASKPSKPEPSKQQKVETLMKEIGLTTKDIEFSSCTLI